MATARWNDFTGGQMKQRQVNCAAPTVARSSCHISFLEHFESVDIRIVPSLLSAVFLVVATTGRKQSTARWGR